MPGKLTLFLTFKLLCRGKTNFVSMALHINLLFEYLQNKQGDKIEILVIRNLRE